MNIEDSADWELWFYEKDERRPNLCYMEKVKALSKMIADEVKVSQSGKVD